jgi:hypothetical protein
MKVMLFKARNDPVLPECAEFENALPTTAKDRSVPSSNRERKAFATISKYHHVGKPAAPWLDHVCESWLQSI